MKTSKVLGILALAAGVAALSRVSPTAQGPGGGGVARTDISGYWTSTNNEDIPHRNPGAELGDYTGLPINDAERQKAEAWDASILSQPERQTQAHPAQYFMRGPRPDLRILKVLDPVTQAFLGYAVAGTYGRADRVVWMDGRPHPSDFSEHTWNGYSTGSWENGQLVIVTTHMKQGVYQRNGVAASPYAKMVEHFFRHGDLMTSFFSVDDPIFLEEPLARTQSWSLTYDEPEIGEGTPFLSVDELGDKPLGWVPFWPLGTMQTEFSEVHNIPLPATLGGKETTYPEYQAKIAEMMAAKKEIGTKK